MTTGETRRGTGRVPLRVLIVEDSEDDALLLLRELKRGGYEPLHERVDTPEAMRAALQKQNWDVVVSDHAMPTFSAPAALELLRKDGLPDLPFIIVSGHIGEDAAVKAMKAGAHDYVAKDSLARLTPAIERELRDAEARRQRRQAQEALLLAEKKYRGIFENSAEGIFQTSVDGHMVTANPMMARIFGYDSPEEMTRTLHNVAEQLYVEPSRRAEFARRMRQDGRVFEFETQLRRKDGGAIWVSTNARTIYDDSGKIAGYEGTVEDITERKRAVEALRESEERRRTVLANAPVVLFALDREGVFTLSEGRGLEAMGLRAGQGVGRSIFDVYRDEPESLVHIRRALAGEEFTSVDHLRALGLVFEVRWSSVRDPSGNLTGVIGVATDVTERKKAEDENARLYGELAERERRLQELVGKILVAQEEERRRVAYEVHDGLAQVAAAAHQHLQAFTQYHPPTSQEGCEDLARVSKLVRQTVGEARQIIADLRPTALDDLGLEAAVRLQLEAKRAEGWRIGYESNLDDERLPASVESALFRVTQEALNNVGKHAHTQRVSIALKHLHDPREAIRLSVRDYGIGFSPDAPVEAPGPGERIGLSGMRERVVLLGGDFRVASRPGAGTLIVAEVPLREPAGDGAGRG